MAGALWDRTSSASRPVEKFVTLSCPTCDMALYMSERVLQKPTWTCPACGAITETKAA